MDVKRKFPTRLKRWKYEIERLGRKHGLNFPETIFYVVSSEEMSEFLANGGYPISYHHWTKGQESLRMKKQFTRFAMGKVFEVIIPTVPAYSLLVDTNEEHEQKSVIAHAELGHGDFFLNNIWFKSLPDNIHQLLEFHADTIDELRVEHGKAKVDRFLEACLSVSNLMDILSSVITREVSMPDASNEEHMVPASKERPEDMPEYMEDIINPPSILKERRRVFLKEAQRNIDIQRGSIIPAAPVRDILGFLSEYASLEPWQREVMRIIRDEAIWTWTGAQTKIMNEGWARFWDSELIVIEKLAVESEVFSLARKYAQGVSIKRDPLNPYGFGNALWQDIRFRWDTGRYGPIWNDCKRFEIKEHWDSFVVFKLLYERYGAVDERLLREWGEFVTMVDMTNRGDGRHSKDYFTQKDWALEWLAFERADERLAELVEIQKKVEWLEREIDSRMAEEGLEPDDLRRFEIHREISQRNHWDPAFNWTIDEVAFEIEDTRKLLNLHSRIRAGEVPIATRDISDVWVEWAEKYSEALEIGVGMKKIFQVRETHNDAMFVHDFFTREFSEKHGYVTYARSKGEGYYGEDVYKVRSDDYVNVKRFILMTIRNVREPVVELIDANFDDGQQLLFRHVHDGRDLTSPDKPEYEHKLREVMQRLWIMWGRKRPVHLETIETTWPERMAWWWYWRPPAYGGSIEVEGPTFKKVRWTCANGVNVEKKEISEFGETKKNKRNGRKLP